MVVREGLRTEGEKKTEDLGLNGRIELVVLLMCNAPTVTSQTLSEGIRILKEHPEYNSAVTVSKYNMWSPLRARKEGADGLLHPFEPFEAFGDPETLNCDRDSQGDVWFADMRAHLLSGPAALKISKRACCHRNGWDRRYIR